MNELQKEQTQAVQPAEAPALAERLAIIEEGLRKNYLTRLDEMEIVPAADRLPALEDDLIDNVRLYHITEMVYKKGESVVDKLTTVFNTLSTYRASVFVVMDSDGKKTDFYLGVRNDEPDENLKRSTVTLGDTLKNALIGHFPGVKIENEDRMHIAALSNKIARQHNAAAVSVVGSPRSKASPDEAYVQGLEKLALAMSGRPYIGILAAETAQTSTSAFHKAYGLEGAAGLRQVRGCGEVCGGNGARGRGVQCGPGRRLGRPGPLRRHGRRCDRQRHRHRRRRLCGRQRRRRSPRKTGCQRRC
ncbi:hypothetical protein [Pseudoramibacter sp.]|jgi:hypothetical protein|uniref:hypothetical protein n=1 Tax=Pseudoramibacter sp. TaxID=2034862 RepID=UPI0025F627A3|nr:hypothetical protein [Pseudoramibacter sp.]MCH4071834.1 hypothetical protein [Pseudoramibacter sp.]MCH4105603.1 hypothetical protein [Pseudoramibacter sp.]